MQEAKIKNIWELLWSMLMLALLCISLAIIVSFFLPLKDAIRASFGGLGIVTVPGLFMSFVFFPNERSKSLRLFLSVLLTLIFLPLLIYIFSLAGFQLNLQTIFTAAALYIVPSLLYLLFHDR